VATIGILTTPKFRPGFSGCAGLATFDQP